MIIRIFLSIFLTLPLFAKVETVTIKKDISYHESTTDAYQNTRCQLDLYLPPSKNFATLIWLHGGGLKGGSKDNARNSAIAKNLAKQSIAVVMVDYRLHPKAKYPAYVKDSAAAVAWTIANIAKHGGDSKKVFLGGHSAGGYLTLMVGMDPRWLKAHQLERSDLLGLIPVAAQTMTHYTVRDERYGSNNPFTITADDASPVRYAGLEGIPPTHILWADQDAPARAAENSYIAAVMKGAGHKAVTTEEIADRNHSSVAHKLAESDDPGSASILRFMNQILEKQK